MVREVSLCACQGLWNSNLTHHLFFVDSLRKICICDELAGPTLETHWLQWNLEKVTSLLEIRKLFSLPVSHSNGLYLYSSLICPPGLSVPNIYKNKARHRSLVLKVVVFLWPKSDEFF